MLSDHDILHGAIVNGSYGPWPSEMNILTSFYGFTEGWGDDAHQLDPVEDLQHRGGEGRFSGVLLLNVGLARSVP
jgi:hypothetical protein